MTSRAIGRFERVLKCREQAQMVFFILPLGNTSMPTKADGMLGKCVVSNCLDSLSHMLSC